MADAIQECRKMLEKWDNNEIVWTIEMSGLGPAYEQCIQITMFEMLRFMVSQPVNWRYVETEKDRPYEKRYYWRTYERTMKRALYADDSPCKDLGLTGAQAGAATSLATVFLARGHQGGLDQVEKERQTMVRKYFPSGTRRVVNG